jgi:predicted DNA-binding protein
MTMTFKLGPELERKLRQRSAAVRRPASAIVREALAGYLAGAVPAETSAYSLGADLFGRHRGPADLSERRKEHFAEIIAGKQRARRG